MIQIKEAARQLKNKEKTMIQNQTTRLERLPFADLLTKELILHDSSLN